MMRSCLVILCLFVGACGYTGAARDLNPEVWKHERGWISVDDVPMVLQKADHDCGPAALAMVLAYWHRADPSHRLDGFPPNARVAAAALRDRARTLGLSAFVIEGTLNDIKHELLLKRPVIVGLAKPTTTGPVSHYEVVIGIHPASKRVVTLDPANGLRQNTFDDFAFEWISAGRLLLVVLPTQEQEQEQPAVAARESFLN